MKPATLRIHRGPASPERVLFFDNTELGRLAEATSDFTVPSGHHLVGLRFGPYHSLSTHVALVQGGLVELTVEENPETIAPLLQGGWLRFHKDQPLPHRAPARRHSPSRLLHTDR